MFRKSLYLFVLVGLSASFSLLAAAYLTAQATVTNNQFTNGTVAITTNPTSALVTYNGMAPGDRVTAPLQVSNGGSLALRYAMTTSVPNVVTQYFIGGDFTTVNGQVRQRLALLNPDGSLGPTTFSTPNFLVSDLARQSDGKVIAVGNAIRSSNPPFDLSKAVGVLRLNPDGSLDPNFHLLDLNGTPDQVEIQSNGQIVIGGYFTQVDGQAHHRIARLNADGTLDAAFTTQLDSDVLNALALQPDDKILVGGWFTQVNGQAHHYIARLNADGTVDASFNASLDNGSPAFLNALAVQENGQILVSGYFTQVNGGQPRTYLARFNSDGTLDASFDVALNDDPESVALWPNGQILLGGYFTTVNGQARAALARVNADGSLDLSFNPSLGWSVGSPYVSMVALQPDGKILISGRFDTVNGVTRNHIARLNRDGSVDSAFDAGMDGSVYQILSVGGLAAQLQLSLKSGVTTCTNGGFTDGTLLYRGSLAAAFIGDPSAGFQTGDRPLNAAAGETLCFQASLPLGSGNAYQNTTTTATFTFDAEQTANNP